MTIHPAISVYDWKAPDGTPAIVAAIGEGDELCRVCVQWGGAAKDAAHATLVPFLIERLRADVGSDNPTRAAIARKHLATLGEQA